jgi:hypothetical protein
MQQPLTPNEKQMVDLLRAYPYEGFAGMQQVDRVIDVDNASIVIAFQGYKKDSAGRGEPIATSWCISRDWVRKNEPTLFKSVIEDGLGSARRRIERESR